MLKQLKGVKKGRKLERTSILLNKEIMKSYHNLFLGLMKKSSSLLPERTASHKDRYNKQAY